MCWQRLRAKHVERRTGEMAFVDQREQVGVDDELAARYVDYMGAARQLRQRGTVEKAVGRRRRGKRADEHAGGREERAELAVARVARDARERLARPAPGGQGKAERGERRRDRQPEHAAAQEPDAERRLREPWSRLPAPFALQRLIGVRFAIGTKHGERHVFRHLLRHAGILEADDGDVARERRHGEQRVDAGAEIEDRLRGPHPREELGRGTPDARVRRDPRGHRATPRSPPRAAPPRARRATRRPRGPGSAAGPSRVAQVDQVGALGDAIAGTIVNRRDDARSRRGDRVLHLHRLEDDERRAALDLGPRLDQHRDHGA